MEYSLFKYEDVDYYFVYSEIRQKADAFIHISESRNSDKLKIPTLPQLMELKNRVESMSAVSPKWIEVINAFINETEYYSEW